MRTHKGDNVCVFPSIYSKAVKMGNPIRSDSTHNRLIT